VVIAPPAIYLIPVKESVRKEIQVAAQNCYFKESGAYTGEIRCVFVELFFLPTTIISILTLFIFLFIVSPKQLVDAGIPYVILGKIQFNSEGLL